MFVLHRLTLAASICFLAAAVSAADSPPSQNPQPVTGGAAPNSSPILVEQVAPVDLAREARRAAFDAVLATQDAKIQALTNRLAALTDDSAGQEIQREIEREKLATNRLLLELQLDFAKRDGNEEKINVIKAALEALDAAPPVLLPIDRPAPANLGR